MARSLGPGAVAEALQIYRRQFTPARPGDRPHAILGLKVIVGQDDEHADALALPWHLALVQHRAGNAAPLMNVEGALRHRWTEAERAAEAKIDRRADIVAGPERARERIDTPLAETEADEVIASSNTFDPIEREASYARLALAVGLRRRPLPDPWLDLML